jgi:protein-S-isoprenylcysteine O-methyltransferase Ste14
MAFVAVMFHLRVILYEEPVLDQLFRDERQAYSASVSRWLPRLRTRER